MRSLAVSVAVLAIVAAGCAQDDQAPREDLSGPVTRTVQVDGTPDDYSAFALAYFPNSVTVRPGDTVRFTQVWTGEPHSVTMGALIDDTVAELRKLALNAEQPEELADAYEKLPVMLPEGPGDANQIAANPCYIEAGGSLPTDPSKPCETRDAPAFDGTQAYFSSGFIAPGEDVEVELADDIEPGTYVYYCNLHELAMTGEIVVTDEDDIPSQAEVDTARDAQLTQHFAALTAAYTEQVRAGGSDLGTLAGFGAEGPPAGTAEFAPEAIEVEAGDSVTWNVIGPHTITFNPPSGVGHLLVEAEDGTFHRDPRAFAPAEGPGMPEHEPEGPVAIDGGSFDGKSFRSSGVIVAFPPDVVTYELTFSTAGDYRYVCLVHPAMTGTVKVT